MGDLAFGRAVNHLARPHGEGDEPNPSILGRLLDVIDDKNLNWRFGRFEFQSKLFLERGENRETRWIGNGASPRGGLRRMGTAASGRVNGPSSQADRT